MAATDGAAKACTTSSTAAAAFDPHNPAHQYGSALEALSGGAPADLVQDLAESAAHQRALELEAQALAARASFHAAVAVHSSAAGVKEDAGADSGAQPEPVVLPMCSTLPAATAEDDSTAKERSPTFS